MTFQQLTSAARSCALLGLALFVLSLALPAQAQNARTDGIVWSRTGYPSPGASIAVCTQPATTTTTPCSPLASLCSSLTDNVCTSPNPVIADSLGNYFFYVKPGTYTLQFYNSGMTARVQPDQVLACGPSSSCTVSATITLVGDGAVGAPAYSFTSEPTSGLYRSAAGEFRFSILGADFFRVKSSTAHFALTSGAGYCFGSSGTTSVDGCLWRIGAGSMGLGSATVADTSGSLTLANLISTGNAGTSFAFSGRDLAFTSAAGSSSAGGNLTSTLGPGSGANAGGAYAWTGGNGGATGAGGGHTWTAGNGGATSGAAGSFIWNCGTVVSGTGCSLQFNAKASIYNSITLVRNGLSSEVAAVDATSQTAAITTTTLYAVPASGAGQYSLSWNAKVTTAAGVSSTLGALTIVYTDPDGVTQTITAGALTSAGAIATTSTTNTTAAVLLGLPILINAKASTNITYAFAYASNAANAMNYNLHITLQAQ